MPPITTQIVPKPFTWTYSKLKNYESCPKRYYETDVIKSTPFQDTDATLMGKAVHEALAKRIEKGTPLPVGMQSLERWAKAVLEGAGDIRVEQKMGFTKELGPSEFFATNVWCRCVADVVKLADEVALVIDWKNGKIVEDSVQLAINAQAIFSNFPKIQYVRTKYVWFQEGAETQEDFSRDDMIGLWTGLLPRIEALEAAHKTTTFPAVPCYLCSNWCAVLQCPHNGKKS